MSNQAAWLMEAKTKPLEVRDAPIYEPGPDEVLIKNSAAAVNPVDWKFQDYGTYVPNYPTILGNDVAGVIDQLGSNVTRFAKGDRVMGHCRNLITGKPDHGSFQDYTVVTESLVSRIPDNVSFEQASVLPLALSTAGAGLYAKDLLDLPYPSQSPRSTGKVILVWGGSTSVGSTAIQLALASGVAVVATASPRNYEYVKALGASAVVDYNSSTVVDECVKALKGLGEFAGIYDSISEESTLKSVTAIGEAMGGSKVVLTLPDEKGLLQGSVSGRQVYAATWIDNDKEAGEAVWSKWVPEALASGSLKPKPDPIVVDGGVTKAQEALDKHKAGVSAGKVVLKIR